MVAFAQLSNKSEKTVVTLRILRTCNTSNECSHFDR